jgi:hypothetical protein
MREHMVEPATTLVWIDSQEAIIVTWSDGAALERVHSDVPGRHRSTGHVRIDPSVRHGGGGALPELAERVRRARLSEFVDDVALRLPPADDVVVIGPGLVRARLARSVQAADRRLGRHRLVESMAADRLTEQELVARARVLCGHAPRRVLPS